MCVWVVLLGWKLQRLSVLKNGCLQAGLAGLQHLATLPKYGLLYFPVFYLVATIRVCLTHKLRNGHSFILSFFTNFVVVVWKKQKSFLLCFLLIFCQIYANAMEIKHRQFFRYERQYTLRKWSLWAINHVHIVHHLMHFCLLLVLYDVSKKKKKLPYSKGHYSR